jgi:hypothetical protein
MNRVRRHDPIGATVWFREDIRNALSAASLANRCSWPGGDADGRAFRQGFSAAIVVLATVFGIPADAVLNPEWALGPNGRGVSFVQADQDVLGRARSDEAE